MDTLKTKKIIEDPSSIAFFHLLLLSDGRLASCSNNGRIQIYNINNNYHCDLTINFCQINGFTYMCQLENNKLITCSSDKSIKIWSIEQLSYQCDYTIINAHENIIYKVIPITNNRIASCSMDKTIKIWNSNHPYNLIKELNGHTKCVTSIIQLKGKEILISGARDKTFRIWNILTYQCATIINEIFCSMSNSLLELNNNRIIVGEDKSVAIINLDKYYIEHRKSTYMMSDVKSLMKLNNGNILCGSFRSVFIYDIINNTFVDKIYKLHDAPIYCLLSFNDNTFVSCSYDQKIKVWEF